MYLMPGPRFRLVVGRMGGVHFLDYPFELDIRADAGNNMRFRLEGLVI